ELWKGVTRSRPHTPLPLPKALDSARPVRLPRVVSLGDARAGVEPPSRPLRLASLRNAGPDGLSVCLVALLSRGAKAGRRMTDRRNVRQTDAGGWDHSTRRAGRD